MGNLNDSIQQLRQAVTQLEKREVHLDKKIQVCLNNAKAKSKRRDKKGALFELKKKKQLENQLQSIQGKKLNLETQIMALEDAHLNKETLKAMKTSAKAMKATVKEADLDKADELMSQPLGQIIDDDELLAELDDLDDMNADELLNSLPEANNQQQNQNFDAINMDLPSAPTGKIKQQQDEDDELADLEKLMDMN